VLVAEPLALIDYLVLVHPTTLEDVPEWYRGEALLAVAGRVGTTRLIDNLPIKVGPGGGALEVFSDVHAEPPVED
jgi:pantoate--beta-alanine ligase